MPTHPGVNPQFDLNHFSMAERQAIMRLSQQFYITRAAKSVQTGNSSYRVFLMRPTEAMSRRARNYHNVCELRDV